MWARWTYRAYLNVKSEFMAARADVAARPNHGDTSGRSAPPLQAVVEYRLIIDSDRRVPLWDQIVIITGRFRTGPPSDSTLPPAMHSFILIK